MANTLLLYRGDTTPDVTCVLSNDDGVQDLSGATVVARLKTRGGSTNVVNCTVDSPTTAGTVRIARSLLASLAVGKYDTEYFVTYGDASTETFPQPGANRIVMRDRRT